MGLADLHIHTIYSYDGTATVRAVLERARQLGLDVIAITDHMEVFLGTRIVNLVLVFGVGTAEKRRRFLSEQTSLSA